MSQPAPIPVPVPAPAPRPRLTRAQARRVRELIEDEGSTQAAAIAWVRTFEPELAS